MFESEKEVRFAHASFGVDLVCANTTFKGPTNFRKLKCGTNGIFENARFLSEEEVVFSRASFGVDLVCLGATFKGPASFHALKCNGGGLFREANFEGKTNVDFSFASFGVSLEFSGAHFAGPVDLAMACITQGLVLSTPHFPNTCFPKKVTLLDATAGQLVMTGDTFPFKEEVNLRGFTLKRFWGEKRLAEQLTKAQTPRLFSRDPYLQLERYYSNIGDEVEAKKMHYQGRRDLRENAKDNYGVTKWSPPTKWLDWWTKWLTGYGIRTWRLLWPICFFLIFGTGMFWSDDSLKPRTSATSGTPSGTSVTPTQSNETASSSTSPSEEQGSDSLEQKLVRRGGYSLDLFLPVVNLRLDER